MKLISLFTAALALPAVALDVADYVDAASARVTGSFGIELDDSGQEFDYQQASLHAFVSKPYSLSDSWTFASYLEYSASRFDFDDSLLPTADDSLDPDSTFHRVGLPFGLLYSNDSSRWIYGLYGRPYLSSDFDDGLSSDDFFLDLGAGVLYRFNDCFVAGLGVYGNDVLDDSLVIPGAAFAWAPDDNWLVSFYGPRFIARRDLSDNTSLGLEIANNGGAWHTDAYSESLKVSFQSWRAGLYVRQRLFNDVWLQAGVGYALANSLDIEERDGDDEFFSEDASGAPYATIGLTVKQW